MLIKRECFYCGSSFSRQLSPDNIQRGKGKYCNKECGAKQSALDCKNGKRKIYTQGLLLGRVKGKKFSIDTRRKISASLLNKTGPLSRNWRGGVTPINNLLRKRNNYKLWRKSVYDRDNYECQICGESKSGELQAHHIRKFSDFPEQRTNILNGITLCKKCHIGRVNSHEKDWESYFNFNLETKSTPNASY